jgi:hypothetical protein
VGSRSTWRTGERSDFYLLFPIEITSKRQHFAPGLGLHLQALASRLPDKFDMHEPWRKLTSLSPYEHLHRLFRFCIVHCVRNIRETAVSDNVKNLMRSLICIEHSDWAGTVKLIETLGGKAGSGADVGCYSLTTNVTSCRRLGEK